MLPAIRECLGTRLIRPRETWLLLPEHQTYSRIPDLLFAKLDVPNLLRRLRQSTPPLVRTELLILQTLREDRRMRLATLASALHLGTEHVRRVLARLERYGLVAESAAGVLRRLETVRPFVTRLVSVEAKRSRWRSALVQARAHRPFSNEAWVAFDAAFISRFRAVQRQFVASGIGLLAIDAATNRSTIIVQPSPRLTARSPLAFSVVAELVLARLTGAPIRQLPQTRLPNGSGPIVRPARPLLVGPYPKSLQRHVRGVSRAPRGL